MLLESAYDRAIANLARARAQVEAEPSLRRGSTLPSFMPSDLTGSPTGGVALGRFVALCLAADTAAGLTEVGSQALRWIPSNGNPESCPLGFQTKCAAVSSRFRLPGARPRKSVHIKGERDAAAPEPFTHYRTGAPAGAESEAQDGSDQHCVAVALM